MKTAHLKLVPFPFAQDSSKAAEMFSVLQLVFS